MSDTKRLSKGLYIHIKTGKYIALWEGELSDAWNVWNDENLCSEFAVGYFLTKWQCVEYLNEISK